MTDDYISRSKLQEVLIKKKAGAADRRYTEGFNDALMRFKSMVHGAPAEDVAPLRHGRWEEIRNAYGDLEGWICKCGRESECKEKYCPNCGAKMDLEDGETK